MAPGTVLPVEISSTEPAVERYIPDRIFEPFNGNIRAVAGPQFDYFSRKGQQDFFSRPFQVGRSAVCDLRLKTDGAPHKAAMVNGVVEWVKALVL